MLVQVYAYYADTCGNEDTRLHGVYEAPSVEAAEVVFPRGFLTGWRVVPLEVKPLPDELQQTPPEF